MRRGFAVVGEYADAVESGKDEDRPAWLRLLRDLRAPGREWGTVLATDTSRIARGRLIALTFERDCKRHKVQIVYQNLPEADAATDMMVRAVFQAFDEYHSLVSKAKGLAGMRENVRQGWRAGGRAPRGYRLEYVPTGAVRDGQAVTKSRLVVDEQAEAVRQYLRARAAGEMRGMILSRLGLDWPTTSLNGMEWQALTYAGHTVWNVHAERAGGESLTGERRRPRAEWLVQRDTHQALISDDEAERILERLETQRATHRRNDADQYLLTGLLVTPEGKVWAGDGSGYYRIGKGRRIAARRIDTVVLDQVFSDLAADEAIERVMQAMRDELVKPVDGRTVSGLEKRVASLSHQVARTVDLAAHIADPAPILRRVADLEAERAGIVDQLDEMRRRQAQRAAISVITPEEVRSLLDAVRDEIMATSNVEEMRTALDALLERIVLDPDTLTAALHYRVSGEKVASRSCSEMTPVRWVQPITILPRRRAA